MRTILFVASCLVTFACATAPEQSPQAQSAKIVADLEAGRAKEAAAAFDAVADRPDYRQSVYPAVYEAARRHWSQNELTPAQALLQFLSERFPQAMAVREALLYVYFVRRGEQEQPDAAALDHVDRLLGELRAGSRQLSPWVELVAVQHHVDRGRLDEGRAALQEFRQHWDGKPRELAPYVEDLQRWLASHSGGDGHGASAEK